MVTHLLGLKLRLLANTFRRSPIQIVGVVIALLFGIALTVMAVTVLRALRSADVAFASGIVVTGGALIVLGFLLVPLAFGADDSLDPRAFSLFGMPTGRLALALAVAALVAVPAIILAVIAVAQILTWARSPLATIVAILAAVLIVATCVLGARLTTSVASFLLATRRAREFTSLVALLIIVSLAPVIAILAAVDWQKNGTRVLGTVAGIAGWTPLGAAWSAPADAAAGQFGRAVLKLAIALAFLGILWLAWRVLVHRMLVKPQRVARDRSYVGLGWFDRMPDSPAGAIAARSLTYWTRDARYHTSLLAIPLAPVVFVVALAVAGVPPHALALIPLPAMLLFLSWSLHNDVSYDNTAIWLHVASNVSGAADRFGRLVPALMMGIPLVLVGAPVSTAFYGDWAVLPAVFGVSSSILLAGLGLSSIFSARFPYAAVRPGDGPFAQPQTSGSGAGLIQTLSFFSTLIVTVPTGYLGYLGLEGETRWFWAALVLGLVTGVGMFVLGVRWGGAIFRRRGPELLAFTLRN